MKLGSKRGRAVAGRRRSGLAGLAICGLLTGCGEGGPSDGGDEDESTDEGTPCGTESCQSLLTIELQHDFPFDGAPTQVTLLAPRRDIKCSVPGDETAGADSCFGFPFANIAWEETSLEVQLIDPFFDAELNPDNIPWEMLEVVVTREGAEIGRVVLDLDAGAPEQPNGPDCAPSCFDVRGGATI